MTNTTTNKPHLARTGLVASLMAAGALMAGAPAHAAGKAERARQAIATAQAKIQTADALGTAEVQPRESAQAKAALAHAQENLAAGHKPEAIDDAIHASALADTAIGTMQKRQARAADEQAATQQAALDDARQQAMMAQQQVDAANSRADMATAAAQSSAAEAAAARQAAATAMATPATVETTVTTHGTTRVPARKVAVRKVVHHPVRTASASGTVTTTTRITR